MNWWSEYNLYFKEKDVVIIEYNDEIGKSCIEKLIKNLLGVVYFIKVINFLNILLFKGLDLVDYFNKYSVNDLKEMIQGALFIMQL